MAVRRSFPECQALITALSSIIQESHSLGIEFETTFLKALGEWLDFQTGAESGANAFIIDQLRNYSQLLGKRQEALTPHLKTAETVLAHFERFKIEFDEALKKQKAAGASRLAFEKAKQNLMDNATSKRAAFFEEQRDKAKSEMTFRITEANDARDAIMAADCKYRNSVVDFLKDLLGSIAADFESTVSEALTSLEKAQELVSSFEIGPDPKVEELQNLLVKLQSGDL